jgi:hypothetical protein
MSDDDDDEIQPGFGVDPTQPTVDVADNAVRALKIDTLKRQRLEDQAAWLTMLSTVPGRRVLWNFLQQCGTFTDQFVCGPNGFPQPDATFFKAGAASVGKALYKTLARVDRVLVFQMHDEHDPDFMEPPKPKRKRKDD